MVALCMPDAILVTGAAGFIGSHLVDALLARGDYVVGIDNLNSFYDPASKRSNLAAVEGSATRSDQFTFVNGDVRDRDLVRRVFQEHRVRRVAHLAAMAGVRASIEDPGLYVDVNVLGTLSVLDAARDARVENMVLASTSSVYGATDRAPFVETDASDRPLAPYPASKRAAEIFAYSYHHLYGLDVTVLRFFTVYGPRNRPDMMAHKVLHSIVRG